jgi:hypothetical protein
VSDLFLGVIAAAVLTMAIIQVAAIVLAARAARRVGQAAERLELDVKPIVASLQAMSAEAARAASLAAAQVQRAEQAIDDLSRRVDETSAAVQSSLITPAREAFAIVQGIIAALATFRPGGANAPRTRPAAAEEEDPLFIG